jgi:hypothetical protein
MTTAVIMADRDVSDTRLLIEHGLAEAPRDAIPMVDRDGNNYVGRLVFQAHTTTEVMDFVRTAYESGVLPDGSPVPAMSLLVLDLAKRPKGDAPIKFL